MFRALSRTQTPKVECSFEAEIHVHCTHFLLRTMSINENSFFRTQMLMIEMNISFIVFAIEGYPGDRIRVRDRRTDCQSQLHSSAVVSENVTVLPVDPQHK